MKFPICPMDMKFDISLTVLHQSCRVQSQMSDVHDIWLYPLQDQWSTVNEISDFMYTGQTRNFILRPVKLNIMQLAAIMHACQICSLHPLYSLKLACKFLLLYANHCGLKETPLLSTVCQSGLSTVSYTALSLLLEHVLNH